ncbi:MAG: hypothetical protein CMK59_13230 [Proteobacteria bacterium]|nr:hypothetical protein [Pseudomonadota bacterium]
MFKLLNPRFYMENPKTARFIVFVFIVVVGYLLYVSGKERKVCEEACFEEDYTGFRYVGADNNTPARCFCLTEEETQQKGVIPKGTEIEFLSESEEDFDE